MKASHKQKLRAFTLVEVLVSVTVLSVIIVMMAQLIALVGQASANGLGRADNFTKSRAMLDLVVSDLQRAVIRRDLPIFQVDGSYNVNAAANDGGFSAGTYSTSFFTQVPGLSSSAVRNLSCVTYGIVTTPDADKIKLQRSDLAIPWVNGAADIPFQGNLTIPLSSVTARDMAPGVVGFELVFRRADGTVTARYTGYNSTNPVVAVGVTLAVIGSQALPRLTVSDLTSIRTKLAGYVTGATTISSVKALWDANLTPDFFTQYPSGLGPNLLTFERWVVPTQPF
ncbi:MAG TPA: prepilin-type N-terminal cleavage/methylation domain-containing protein [Candidatus Methylacidiphilales bacterium]|nr:prepilin-type N-terminal cleavage/methylation domain-containing protein [Candidatus Methylacidiphilales bacterium]